MLLKSDIKVSEKLNSDTRPHSEDKRTDIKKPSSKRLQVFLRIAVSVLFVIIVNRSITGRDTEVLFSHFSAIHIGAAFLLSIIGLFLQVTRWKMVLGRMDFIIGFKDALKTMLWGNLLAFITPGRIGELFRAVSIDNERKIDAIVAVMVERAYAILTTFIFGFLFLIFSFVTGPELPLRYIVPMITTTLLLLFIAIFGKRCGFLFTKVKRIRFLSKIPEIKLNIKVVSWKIFLLSIITHLFLLTQTTVLLSMFSIQDPWSSFSISGQAFAFMIFLPFFIANIGLREYSFGMFLSQNHAGIDGMSPAGIALGISSLVLLLNIVLPAIAGLIWYLFDNSKKIEYQPH
jgi:hypothetical protein